MDAHGIYQEAEAFLDTTHNTLKKYGEKIQKIKNFKDKIDFIKNTIFNKLNFIFNKLSLNTTAEDKTKKPHARKIKNSFLQ